VSAAEEVAGWDALRIAPDDHVAVALRDLSGVVRVRQGAEIVSVTLPQPIPLGHKFALADLPIGSEVRKYGAPIGVLTRPVSPGEHVHVHNLASRRAKGAAAKA
jgi:hypothetical protein